MDQLCILRGFIYFQKNFEKFRKLSVFRPKTRDFRRFSRIFPDARSFTEKVSTLRQMLQMPWFLVRMFLGAFRTKLRGRISLIFCFSRKTDVYVRQIGDFWFKMAENCQKSPIWRTYASVLRLKQKIKEIHNATLF